MYGCGMELLWHPNTINRKRFFFAMDDSRYQIKRHPHRLLEKVFMVTQVHVDKKDKCTISAEISLLDERSNAYSMKDDAQRFIIQGSKKKKDIHVKMNMC